MAGPGCFYIAGGGTGGHLYPGLAIADALIEQRPDLDIAFIGARRGIERIVLPTTRWRHELLDLHPLYRSAPWKNIHTIRGMGSAVSRIRTLVSQRPAIGVLGTGGYAAGALLAYARVSGTPYFLQEQNAYAGLTVRLFSPSARATFLGFPEAASTLPATARANARFTGNPITPPPQPRPLTALGRARWGFPEDVRQILLVFGGSQGSRAINDAMAAFVAAGELPERWGMLWITGPNEHARLLHHASDRIRVIAYQQPMAQAYDSADLAVGRAGAMSTAELCAWGIPMILVPLPTAAADHQTINARALAAHGAAASVLQASLGSGALGDAIRRICRDAATLATMGGKARDRARVDAAQVIAVQVLESLDLT